MDVYSCASSARRASSRPVASTFAPSNAQRFAIARPIPDVAPVTRTVRPSSRPMGAIAYGRGSRTVHRRMVPACAHESLAGMLAEPAELEFLRTRQTHAAEPAGQHGISGPYHHRLATWDAER